MATQKFIVVRVSGQEMALPAGRVRGMSRVTGLALTPLEGPGPWRYSVDMDGERLSVLVPHAAFGLAERPISCRSCLLLLDDRPEAILVDSVSRFEQVRADCLRPPSRIRLGEKWRTLLDPDQLRANAA